MRTYYVLGTKHGSRGAEGQRVNVALVGVGETEGTSSLLLGNGDEGNKQVRDSHAQSQREGREASGRSL